MEEAEKPFWVLIIIIPSVLIWIWISVQAIKYIVYDELVLGGGIMIVSTVSLIIVYYFLEWMVGRKQ